ncbi:transcriptional regulator [bacterium]|nr:transcriptional regulator [bacterium]
MELSQSHQSFIHTWGTLGGNWGINKTMAQIHALLLIAPDPLDTEEIMKTLVISRGNTSMNIRALIDWGLVNKHLITGERKEYFVAKKDIWVIARLIAKQRRKLELEPVLGALKEIKTDPDAQSDKEFMERVTDIEEFAEKIDKIMEKFIASDEQWFYKMLLKLV